MTQNRAFSGDGRLRSIFTVRIFFAPRLAQPSVSVVVVFIGGALTPGRRRSLRAGVIRHADRFILAGRNVPVVIRIGLALVHFPAAKDSDVPRVRCPNRRRYHPRCIVDNWIGHRVDNRAHQ